MGRQKHPRKIHSDGSKYYWLIRPLTPAAVRQIIQAAVEQGWQEVTDLTFLICYLLRIRCSYWEPA
jgi:hypothetical protein